MLVAQYNPGNKDLTVKGDYPKPTPPPGKILLKVAACGGALTSVYYLITAESIHMY